MFAVLVCEEFQKKEVLQPKRNQNLASTTFERSVFIRRKPNLAAISF